MIQPALVILENTGQVLGRPARWIVLPRLRANDRAVLIAFTGHSRGPFTSRLFARAVARLWTARTPLSVTWEVLHADQYEAADAPLAPHPTPETALEGTR